MSQPCGCSGWYTGYPWAPYYNYFSYYPYPYWQGPWAQPSPAARGPIMLPQELLADSEKKEVFVGGEAPVNLILEYMPHAAGKGTVTVAIADAGKKSEWSDKDISDGYHVKHDLPKLAPGATILLAADGVVARLRWCEVVEY